MFCNLPEIWTTLNSKHDISDLGNVRRKEDGTVLHRYKVGRGYAGVTMHGTWRKVHPWVLSTFVPKPSPMYTCCDHINRDRMDPRLINLRWSNVVLNGLNKEGVRGYSIVTINGVEKYYPRLKLLGMKFRLPPERIAWKAKAAYEFWHRRAFEVIDALCSRNMHWKFQRLILEFWMPVPSRAWDKMKWERDPVHARHPQNGALTSTKRT